MIRLWDYLVGLKTFENEIFFQFSKNIAQVGNSVSLYIPFFSKFVTMQFRNYFKILRFAFLVSNFCWTIVQKIVEYVEEMK